jgi:hypothetical protein
MFQVKDSGGQCYLEVSILGKEHDPEWLLARVDYNQDGFAAKFEFSLMLGEIVSFAKALQLLYSTLKGEARFANIEDNINLVFSTDGLGHVNVEGTLRDTSYTIRTTFLIITDQTFLKDIINGCVETLNHYGVSVK